MQNGQHVTEPKWQSPGQSASVRQVSPPGEHVVTVLVPEAQLVRPATKPAGGEPQFVTGVSPALHDEAPGTARAQ